MNSRQVVISKSELFQLLRVDFLLCRGDRASLVILPNVGVKRGSGLWGRVLKNHFIKWLWWGWCSVLDQGREV